jgi:cold shock CspA family protein
MATNEILQGTVVKFWKERAYGFILTENEDEYFFHASAVSGHVIMGGKVSFMIGTYRTQPVAINVKNIEV